jgi:hypothetical protein
MKDLVVILGALSQVAEKIRLGGEAAKHLITDPNMETAWRQMLKQARAAQKAGQLAARLTALPPKWTVEHWGINIHTIVPRDLRPEGAGQAAQAAQAELTQCARACIAFYCCAAIELGVAIKPVKRADILAQASKLRAAADSCREALQFADVSLDPEVPKSLLVSASYLEKWAELTLQAADKDDPHVYERQRGNPKIRALAKALSKGTRTIFGAVLYRTIKRVMAVATGEEIDVRLIREWSQETRPDKYSARKGRK